MPRNLRLLLKFAGILVIGIAVFGDLPALWALLLGAGGAVMFFSSGST